MLRNTARALALSSAPGACLLLGATPAPTAYTPTPVIYNIDHAANAIALARIRFYSRPVMRDDVGTLYADTGSSCADADGFAQVQPAPGHCWKIASVRWTPRIWGATGGDDSAAWQKALAYLGALGGPQRLEDDLPTSTVSAAGLLVVPSNVSIGSGKRYEGGDGASMPTIRFTSATGGLYLSDKSSISGLNLASTVADHPVEIGGQVGIDHVRVSTANSGVLTTTTIAPGRGALDAIGSPATSTVGNGTGAGGATGSTLTNGTYTKRTFTGGGGSGATVTITVANNVIASGSFDGAGTGYATSFQMGLAAGALYSGSPALSNIATGVTINGGRSHISYLFVSSTGKGVGLAMPPGYDFEDADHVEVWNGTGAIRAGSVGFTFGKIDGLNATTFKCFGYDTCFLGNGPATMVPDFQTFTDPHCDLSNYCLRIDHPEKNLAVVGGYLRSVGYTVILNSPKTNFSLTGTSHLCQGQSCIAVASSNTGAISGNQFSRDVANSQPYISISPPTNDGSLSSVAISGNSFDKNGPGIYVGPYAFNVAVGKNAWPYGSFYAYASGVLVNSNIDPVHNNAVSVTPDANGKFTIASGVGYASTSAYLRLLSGGTKRVEIVSVDAKGVITGRILTAVGAAVTSGTFTVCWGA